MSVTRKPNSSSMTTTSPRAIGLPFTSRSTGSPARRFSATIAPGPRLRVSPIVMRVRPISTASSTGTSCTRARSAGAGSRAGTPSRAVNSISLLMSLLFLSRLLNGHVGEQHVVHLHVGVGPDVAQDRPLELRATPAIGEVGLLGVGHVVGHDG